MPFKFYLYAFVFIGLIAGVLGVIYSYNSAIARAKTLEADVATLQSSLAKSEGANADLIKRHAELQLAFEKNRRERNAITAKWEQTNAKLQQAIRTDPKSVEWANTPIPAAVLASLQPTAAAANNVSTGKTAGAQSPAHANPVARTERGN
jgi:hypothetical protein